VSHSGLRCGRKRTVTRVDDRTIPDRLGAVDEDQRLRTILERLATLDPSTHLYSREHFIVLAQREVASAARDRRAVSFLILHLDDAHRAHDGAIGDRVLNEVAATISESVRVLDLVGRYGGDKFAVMLPETAAADACLVAERIRERIADLRIPTGTGSLRITASIAAASVSADDEAASDPLESLLNRSEAALRSARRAGGNQTIAL
jgi:diguanylate cyclase (GGDEF)-like protein